MTIVIVVAVFFLQYYLDFSVTPRAHLGRLGVKPLALGKKKRLVIRESYNPKDTKG